MNCGSEAEFFINGLPRNGLKEENDVGTISSSDLSSTNDKLILLNEGENGRLMNSLSSAKKSLKLILPCPIPFFSIDAILDRDEGKVITYSM